MVRGPDRKVTRADVFAEMQGGKPETATSLAKRLPCHADTVYNRLKELHELDKIATKKAGARSRVWWEPAPDQSISTDVIEDDAFRSAKDPKILRALIRAKNRGEPLTSGNIAEEIDDSQDVVYNRLVKLEERGWIDSFKSGATSKVWWIKPERVEAVANNEVEA